MSWDRQELANFVGAIGAALLIAGYLRYSIQEELLLTSKILLIAGGVVVARRRSVLASDGFGAFSRSALRSWARTRRSSCWPWVRSWCY